MSIYLGKLTQVVINYQYSMAQMCTHEDTLTYNLGAPYFELYLDKLAHVQTTGRYQLPIFRCTNVHP